MSWGVYCMSEKSRLAFVSPTEAAQIDIWGIMFVKGDDSSRARELMSHFRGGRERSPVFCFNALTASPHVGTRHSGEIIQSWSSVAPCDQHTWAQTNSKTTSDRQIRSTRSKFAAGYKSGFKPLSSLMIPPHWTDTNQRQLKPHVSSFKH